MWEWERLVKLSVGLGRIGQTFWSSGCDLFKSVCRKWGDWSEFIQEQVGLIKSVHVKQDWSEFLPFFKSHTYLYLGPYLDGKYSFLGVLITLPCL